MTQNIILPKISEVKAELCRRSFFYFFCEFWSIIESDKLLLNWHIEYLCEEIQTIAEGIIRGDKTNEDLLVNICPGTSKSTIVSIMLPAWLWIRKPDCVILCNTINTNNATKFSLKFRDVVSSDQYKEYFPNIIIRQDSTAFMRLQNTLGGARRQFTTKGSITGDHGHIRIDDDPMDFQTARSDAEAERCIEGYKAYSTRAKPNAFVPYICVAQRLSKQDTPAYVLEVKPNIKKIVLPAWDNGKIYPPELQENYIDGYLNPIHLGEKKLAEKKLELGDLQYLAEFGQDCENAEGYMYSVKKTPTIEDKGISIAVCDPADDGVDYCTTVFARVYENKVFIKDIIYTQKDSDFSIPLNIEKAKENKPYAIHIEKNGIGSIFGKQIKAKYPLVQFFNSKEKKEDRIFSMANIVSKHFYFYENAPTLDYENAVNAMVSFKKIGKNKHDDMPDCISSMCRILIKLNLINIYE